jgi:hypothetical protein
MTNRTGWNGRHPGFRPPQAPVKSDPWFDSICALESERQIVSAVEMLALLGAENTPDNLRRLTRCMSAAEWVAITFALPASEKLHGFVRGLDVGAARSGDLGHIRAQLQASQGRSISPKSRTKQKRERASAACHGLDGLV